MCGIIYAQDFEGKPVNELIENQYIQQIHRGTEGFGIFNGQHLVHAAKEQRILNWLHKPKNQSNLIMFHHRNPTSTINVRKAAHPFSTKGYFGNTEYLLIHNGYIGNDLDLFEKHQEMGIDYQSLLPDLTFNDSEALLWDVALYLEGKQDNLQAYGAIAFVCMKLVDGELDKLYFARNRNPLNLQRTKEGILLSSEGEGEPIDSDQLYTYNYKLNRLTHHWLKIKEWKPYDSDSAYSPVGTILLNQPLNPRSWDDDWNHRWGLHDYSGTPELGYDYDYNEVTEDFELYNRGAIPSKTQVETTIKQYLTLAKGHFETAYWMLEQAYDDLEADTTALGQDQLNLLEAAIFALQADEDYIDATSISNNYGGAQWQRQLIEAN